MGGLGNLYQRTSSTIFQLQEICSQPWTYRVKRSTMVDQKFHGPADSSWSMRRTLDELHRDYPPVSHAPHTSWHLRFSHFHSYGAKYYSYPWCKAVASRVWFSCFEADPLSRCAGDRYRATMLCHGGGRHPQEMVDDMLGMAVSSDHLVNALQYELTL